MELTQKETEKIKEAVQLKFNELIEASKTLDFDCYLELIDKDKFSGLNSNGSVMHSRDELEKIYRPGFSMMEKIESLEFTKVKITVINGTTVVLVNEYRDRTQLKNGDYASSEGGGCQVWSLILDSWKLVSISSSSKH